MNRKCAGLENTAHQNYILNIWRETAYSSLAPLIFGAVLTVKTAALSVSICVVISPHFLHDAYFSGELKEAAEDELNTVKAAG